jgi:AraC-like DNA-binding protein
LVVGNGQLLAEAMAASLIADGACAATDFLVDKLCTMPDPGWSEPRSVHPQLRQAIEYVSSQVPDHVDVASVATAVALSPDYLGRLCKQQTGVSFSATIRWARLLTSLRYVAAGMPVTDAAHLAGFADGSHANRVCWEMTGAPPQDLARAFRDSQFAAPTVG